MNTRTAHWSTYTCHLGPFTCYSYIHAHCHTSILNIDTCTCIIMYTYLCTHIMLWKWFYELLDKIWYYTSYTVTEVGLLSWSRHQQGMATNKARPTPRCHCSWTPAVDVHRRGGSLGTRFRLLAILPTFLSDALAFFNKVWSSLYTITNQAIESHKTFAPEYPGCFLLQGSHLDTCALHQLAFLHRCVSDNSW